MKSIFNQRAWNPQRPCSFFGASNPTPHLNMHFLKPGGVTQVKASNRHLHDMRLLAGAALHAHLHSRYVISADAQDQSEGLVCVCVCVRASNRDLGRQNKHRRGYCQKHLSVVLVGGPFYAASLSLGTGHLLLVASQVHVPAACFTRVHGPSHGPSQQPPLLAQTSDPVSVDLQPSPRYPPTHTALSGDRARHDKTTFFKKP